MSGTPPSARDSIEALRWALSQPLPPGFADALKLPVEFARLSADGLVHVAALDDGRRCALLKTNIGYKSNFEGLLLCTESLTTAETATSSGAKRTYILLAGPGFFEELYVRRCIDARTFEVYFDLN
jgi:hypothetical protein